MLCCCVLPSAELRRAIYTTLAEPLLFSFRFCLLHDRATSGCYTGLLSVVQGVLVHCNVHLKNLQRLEHFVAKALHDWKVPC